MTNIERKEYNINCANFLNWIYVSSIDLKENKYPQVARAGWYEFITDKVIPEKFLAKSYIGRSNHDLKFDSDWNWIMEVVEKIKYIEDNQEKFFGKEYYLIHFEIDLLNGVDLFIDKKRLFSQSAFGEGQLKEAVVQAINQFLIWHNKNK